MKFFTGAGSILASLTLLIQGCGVPPSAGKVDQLSSKEMVVPDGPLEISTPVPPIDPSPVPSLPSTPKYEPEKQDEMKPSAPK